MPNFEEHYKVKNSIIQKLIKELGIWLNSKCPPGWGFSLLIFSFGDSGNLFYISNAQREDMVATMKQFIAEQEGRNIEQTTNLPKM